ncbi:hypothetical protein DY000_02046739 [Brassica cretica]|uniref:Uncharacterized protein n=1 Tax=Brassica cretica TaxID=69181 RepID=A0ABQ7EW19_BRACR|nr:hypothetical protein DY000_02046739 [Brassica cretica]
MDLQLEKSCELELIGGLRSSIANGSKLLSSRVEQAEIVSRERAEVASWGTDRERESA